MYKKRSIASQINNCTYIFVYVYVRVWLQNLNNNKKISKKTVKGHFLNNSTQGYETKDDT